MFKSNTGSWKNKLKSLQLHTHTANHSMLSFGCDKHVTLNKILKIIVTVQYFSLKSQTKEFNAFSKSLTQLKRETNHTLSYIHNSYKLAYKD